MQTYSEFAFSPMGVFVIAMSFLFSFINIGIYTQTEDYIVIGIIGTLLIVFIGNSIKTSY